PGHLAVITGRFRQQLRSKRGREFWANDSPRRNGFKRIFDKSAQTWMAQQPMAEWKAKAMLLLAQNFHRKEIAQRFLEEPAQSQLFQLPLRRQRKRKIDNCAA